MTSPETMRRSAGRGRQGRRDRQKERYLTTVRTSIAGCCVDSRDSVW